MSLARAAPRESSAHRTHYTHRSPPLSLSLSLSLSLLPRTQSLDLATCTVEDLAFTKTFTLTAQRSDFCHALVAYFDTTFSCCHTPVKLDTSPFSEYTHWKQTVFYLQDTFPVHAGEKFTATMTAAPNASNPRDFDIEIAYAFASEKSGVAFERTQPFRLR